jgi:hypothetical protein
MVAGSSPVARFVESPAQAGLFLVLRGEREFDKIALNRSQTARGLSQTVRETVRGFGGATVPPHGPVGCGVFSRWRSVG